MKVCEPEFYAKLIIGDELPGYCTISLPSLYTPDEGTRAADSAGDSVTGFPYVWQYPGSAQALESCEKPVGGAERLLLSIRIVSIAVVNPCAFLRGQTLNDAASQFDGNNLNGFHFGLSMKFLSNFTIT